jgi:soluble lytic murein transglycosylase-like protein
MNIDKRALLLINLVLIVALIISIGVITNKTYEINALETQINNYQDEISKVEEYKEELKVLKTMKEYYQKKSTEINKEFNQLKENLNLQGLTDEELNQVAEIKEETPLDTKTSAIVLKMAKKYDLKPSLILSIMELESKFDQYAVGAAQDRGYMQIIPTTERWLTKEFYDIHHLEYNPDRIFEPEYNIELAAVYLSFLKDSHGEDYNRILSEYNRGPYNLARYFQENSTYETAYSRVILGKESKYLALNN